MNKAAAAISFLRTRVISASDALESLQRISEPLVMIDLFQKCFPPEFAQHRIVWSSTLSVVRACSEFVQLVDARMFPCYDTTEAWSGEEGSLEEIVFFAPFPAWYDEGHEEYTPLEELVLRAVGAIYKEDGHIEPNDYSAPKREVDFDLLKALCAKKRNPLRHLPEAVGFVLKVTGNFWCDLAQEECDNASEWPDWSEQNIEWLRTDWAKARQTLARVHALEAWLSDDPARRAQVERALKIGTKQIEPRPKSRIVSSAEFAAGINPRALVNQAQEWGGINE